MYAYENRPREFAPEYEKQFRANAKAWEFWIAQPPWYRRVSTYWIMEAKKDETRARRLATLIDHSANGRRVVR